MAGGKAFKGVIARAIRPGPPSFSHLPLDRRPMISYTSDNELPTSVDWENIMSKKVRTQRERFKEDCMFIAIAEVMEALHLLHNNREIHLNVLEFRKHVLKKRNQLRNIDDAIDFAMVKGLQQQQQQRFQRDKGERFRIQDFKLIHGIYKICENMVREPILGGCHPHPSIENYKTGLIPLKFMELFDRKKRPRRISFQDCPKFITPFCCQFCGYNKIGQHSIALTGYDIPNEFLIFKNSWGVDWGNNRYGKVHIPRRKENTAEENDIKQLSKLYGYREEADQKSEPHGVMNIKANAWVFKI